MRLYTRFSYDTQHDRVGDSLRLPHHWAQMYMCVRNFTALAAILAPRTASLLVSGIR